MIDNFHTQNTRLFDFQFILHCFVIFVIGLIIQIITLPIDAINKLNFIKLPSTLTLRLINFFHKSFNLIWVIHHYI